MNRRPFMAGNWKMFMDRGEASELVKSLVEAVGDVKEVDIAVAPPFTALETVGRLIQGTNISLASQNMFWEEKGAYTGEVAPHMLHDLGVRYAIIGHSERRQHFGESIENTALKFKAALAAGLIPILCVGERLEEREAGITQSVVERQLMGGLEGLSADEIGE
ncbi:triose-phosphate isomerase family protein, partial [candidate division KSB1 bacterium]